MATKYNVVKTIYGNREGEIIDTFDNIEDAQEQLSRELQWVAEKNDEYTFFPDAKAAESEIAFAEDAREDWDDAIVDMYIDNLRYGIKTGTPFIVSKEYDDCITTECDRFDYDNYCVEIVTEEE